MDLVIFFLKKKIVMALQLVHFAHSHNLLLLVTKA